MILATTAAMAQQLPPQKFPDQYVLTFSPADVETIGRALMARPLSEVRDLYQRLENQAREQNARANMPAPAPEAAK